ncbi:hypothetical protein DICVIV_10164 [Dictyocaulus viviparus]|uniref:Uncharacterized protein n=1 Tax=Dictyocaulus viviparus TaxID=29172 RepID=A0A0D8XJ84_DICVI|nr:hypothetical protein DICVIV_10164 [Dictyocaulus viviparus]
MDSVNDISATESVCSSNCTIDSISDVNSCVSQTFDSENRSSPWPTVERFTAGDDDFGSLARNYGPPLFMCFYHNRCGRPVSRFCDVPLTEAVKALNAQHEHTKYINLVVRFDSCGEEDIFLFLPVLKLLLFRCRINFNVTKWQRCVLLMADYKFASKIVEVMAEFTDKIFELNIGSIEHVREQRCRTDPDTEAKCVLETLQIWLSKCCSYIRCLRLFTFVQLDFQLSLLIAMCPFLSHLSLCRVSGIDCSIFNGIKSLEFNGCGMAYSEQDLHVAKNVEKCFPNLRIIAFRGICFEPVMKSFIRHLTFTGRRFELYQMISLQQFANLVRSTFMTRSHEGDDCIELVNERYGTCLLVRDNRRVYHTPF